MAPATKKRRIFQPLITASMWGTLWQSVWETARKARTPGKAPDGTTVPRLTNGEVITLVMAVMARVTPQRFPLWYQFAAVAYGWETDNDTLNVSDAQRDKLYPSDMMLELWLALFKLTGDLDDERILEPNLSMDGEFSDPVFQGEVRAALIADGAKATITAKVPLPACKDRDGKPGKPRASCPAGSELRSGPNGVPVCVDTTTGKRTVPTYECDPVVIDDPITGIGKMLGTPIVQGVLILGALWLVLRPEPRRYRRRDR